MALYCQEEVSTGVISCEKNTYTSRLDRYLAAKVAAVTFCLAASITASTIFISFLILIKLDDQLDALSWLGISH